MLEKKDHVKRIQEITFEAYKSSGRIAALLDQNTGPSEQLSEELERVAAQIEHGAIELRNLCARYQAPLPPVGQKPALEPLNIAGRAECNEFGWLHIQLNALLPNCRFASPLWITDTITRLLDRLERRNGKLPLLEEALLMIDEHCDIAARQVYDQDTPLNGAARRSWPRPKGRPGPSPGQRRPRRRPVLRPLSRQIRLRQPLAKKKPAGRRLLTRSGIRSSGRNTTMDFWTRNWIVSPPSRRTLRPPMAPLT